MPRKPWAAGRRCRPARRLLRPLRAVCHPAPGPLRRQLYLGAMTPQEMQQAISEPARQGNWSFEPGLVDLLLRDAGEEPGALPLLSHALLETWRRRRARTMTLAGYQETGGVQGAIARTAETVYQQLSTEQQAIARDIFLRLVELGDSGEEEMQAALYTRRRADLAELFPQQESAKRSSDRAQ